MSHPSLTADESRLAWHLARITEALNRLRVEIQPLTWVDDEARPHLDAIEELVAFAWSEK